MGMLQRLAVCALIPLTVACSSGSSERSGGGGSDGGSSDGTVDSSQSGPDGAGDVLGSSDTGNAGDSWSAGDTGSSGDAMGGGDGPFDSPPGDATSCTVGYTLCNGYCVNTANDILNCHTCGTVCPGPNPYCDNGTCTTAPCDSGACSGGTFCCGSSCCKAGQLCCDVPSNIPTLPECTDPVNGTCPAGCPVCP